MLVVWKDVAGCLQLSTANTLSTDMGVGKADPEFGTFKLSSLLELKPAIGKTAIKKNIKENRLTKEQLKAIGLKLHTPPEKLTIKPVQWNVQSESEHTKAA